VQELPESKHIAEAQPFSFFGKGPAKQKMTEDGADRLRKVFGMLINAIMLTSLHGWRIVSCIGGRL